jgi:methionine-gamma-lyase
MAAIMTVMFEFLRPGDVLVHSRPVYGGTHHFIKHVLASFGIESVSFLADEPMSAVYDRVERAGAIGRVGLIYFETPANPTNVLIDFKEVAELANRLSTPERKVYTACDNTYLGPMWQQPLKLGIDLAIYSATKFIGGHSDVIAGSVSGNAEVMARVKTLRTFFGNMAGPWTGWLLMRSLETLKVRTDRMAATAAKVAQMLMKHPKVAKVNYIGHLDKQSHQYQVFKRQCQSAGSMISFEVQGGEAEAFRFLDSLKLVKLAVSLGGTESLAEHPASMTHCDVEPAEREQLGINDRLIRLSVGVEDPRDLIADLRQALKAV